MWSFLSGTVDSLENHTDFRTLFQTPWVFKVTFTDCHFDERSSHSLQTCRNYGYVTMELYHSYIYNEVLVTHIEGYLIGNRGNFIERWQSNYYCPDRKMKWDENE